MQQVGSYLPVGSTPTHSEVRPDVSKMRGNCRRTAVEVCGILHYHKGAPWLRTHGDEIQTFDCRIAAAQQADRAAQVILRCTV